MEEDLGGIDRNAKSREKGLWAVKIMRVKNHGETMPARNES